MASSILFKVKAAGIFIVGTFHERPTNCKSLNFSLSTALRKPTENGNSIHQGLVQLRAKCFHLILIFISYFVKIN